MSIGALLWKLFVAGLILAVGSAAGSWLRGVTAHAAEQTELDPQVRRWLVRAVYPVVVLVAVVAALEYLDVNLTTVAAMAGAATLALGLTINRSLSNVASGALLLTLRPYREGELIECAGEQGVVTDQGAFAVVIARPDGTHVTIPNDVAFASVIRNHSRATRRRVEIAVLVTHEVDLDALRARLLAVAGRDPRVLPEPAPQLDVIAIEDRGVRVAVRAWVAPGGYEAACAALSEAVFREVVAARMLGRSA